MPQLFLLRLVCQGDSCSIYAPKDRHRKHKKRSSIVLLTEKKEKREENGNSYAKTKPHNEKNRVNTYRGDLGSTN